jgi:hypothetical protein
MSISTTQRVSALERTVRKDALAKLTEEVNTSFAPALAAAANDESHTKQLRAVAADIIRKGRAGAEKAALEAFLNSHQPAVWILDCLRPKMFRISADGKRMAEDAPGEHVAVLIPNYCTGQDLLIDARAPAKCESFADAEKKVTAQELLGGKLELLDDLQWSLIIDRRFREPSVNPVFFPKSPTERWYYTKTPLTAEKGKSPSGFVWAVLLTNGSVLFFYPSDYGYVRGGRLVPASQY